MSLRLGLFLGLCALAGIAGAADDAGVPTYRTLFAAEFRPRDGVAAVRIRIEQDESLLRQIAFAAPPERYREIAADGEIAIEDGRVTWRVPKRGGELRYLHVVDNNRGDGGYDARMTDDWALLKADKLFPPMSTRAVRGARAEATLALTGPQGWLFQTRYGRVRGTMAFADPDRDFDRPTGWMIVGHIASRREDIAGRYVLVASPAGQGFHHNDVLAFLQWTLPEIVKLLPNFDERLLIVGAGGDMWRGGLSGAASLYLHADRPFISQNGTSPLLHELIHVGTALSGSDWIVEGLAEYYGLEILRRSGTISASRYDKAFEHLKAWSEDERGCLSQTYSSGPNTARAVLLLHELDHEIRAATAERSSLDDVTRGLVAARHQVTEASLRALVHRLIQRDARTLAELPVCP